MRRRYDAIAEKLFGGINVDRFLLEYDDDAQEPLLRCALSPAARPWFSAGEHEASAMENGDNLMRGSSRHALCALERLALSRSADLHLRWKEIS